MIYVYDVEVFQNFFSITIRDVKSDLKKQFYIYKDVNQLDDIVSLFTNESHWWIGYNSTSFDDPLIQYIIDNYSYLDGMSTDVLTRRISEKASDIIDDKKSKYVDVCFNRFDLMKINRLYKSLKMVAVNLKHNLIQDLPYPFTHEVQPEQVEEILAYNDNDVIITKKLYKDCEDKIKLRQALSSKYKINLINENRSSIANKILERDYSKATRQPAWRFKKNNTQRSLVDFSEIISDDISFESDNLKSLLDDIKSTKANKDTNIEFHALINDTKYDILKGGIHSEMPPEIFESTDNVTITDADVSSYYPYIMINLGVCPAHLNKEIFLSLLKNYTETRVKAKMDNDKVAADGLKIVINSLYGKMGNEHHWLYDLKALYQTTLNGQLFLLMLIERLENAGINVFYANTDGVTAEVPDAKQHEYMQICQQWQHETGFNLDFDKYKKCIIRDVNSYIWVGKDDSIKYKNIFDINRYKNLSKAFDKPILPISISKYFIEGVPVEETITNHTDILDFCMAQKPGSKFDIEYHYIKDGNLAIDECQRANRYYVGKGGGSLYKKNKGKLISMVAGEPVYLLNDVEDRDPKYYPVKYQYYIKEAYKIINLFNSKQTDLFL